MVLKNIKTRLSEALFESGTDCHTDVQKSSIMTSYLKIQEMLCSGHPNQGRIKIIWEGVYGRMPLLLTWETHQAYKSYCYIRGCEMFLIRYSANTSWTNNPYTEANAASQRLQHRELRRCVWVADNHQICKRSLAENLRRCGICRGRSLTEQNINGTLCLCELVDPS